MKFVKSSFLVKIVLAVIVIYATVTLVSLRAQIGVQKAQAAELETQISSIQQDNDRLQERIDSLETDEGVAEAAREKLGMVGKNEIVFYDVSH